MTKQRCGEPTKSGKPCRSWPKRGSTLCATHVTGVTAPKWEAEFLEVLSEWGVVRYAAAKAGISHMTVYRRREASPEFARKMEEAEEASTQYLETEAIRRASRGTNKPVFHRGQEVGFIREYSDTLLIFMLKARRPEAYRERLEVRGNVTHTHRSEIDEAIRELSEELGSAVGG